MVQIAPEHLFYKHRLLWDCLSELMKVRIAPYKVDVNNLIDNQRVILSFKNAESKGGCVNEGNAVVITDRIDSIDSVLVNSLFNGNECLFEIISEIKRMLEEDKPKSLACITIDDPPLFSSNYGCINYNNLISSCKRHNVHCCIAIVPVDTWYHNKKVVRLFHENQQYISLCIHGVLHLKNDLDRNWSINKCASYLNYGIERVKKFEKKTGLRVSRFIVPPHERLSRTMLEAIAQTEIKGVITAGKVYGYTNEVNSNDYLAGMSPAHWAFNKVPIMLRDSLLGCAYSDNKLKERMKNRVILGQPILFVGHHRDFVNTDDIINKISCFVNKLGVKWSPISEIGDRIFEHGANITNLPRQRMLVNKSKIPKHLIAIAYIRRLVCVLRDSIMS